MLLRGHGSAGNPIMSGTRSFRRCSRFDGNSFPAGSVDRALVSVSGLIEHVRQSLAGGTAVLLRCLDRSFACSLAATAFRKIHNGVGERCLRLDYIKDRV